MWFTDLAAKRPLPEAESQPPITPRVVIVHTMDGTLQDTETMFAAPDFGIEAHFGIGCPLCPAGLDGAVWQWMDTDRQADGNLDANEFGISIETCDHHDPMRKWSPKQVDALIRLIGRLCDHYAIPRQVCPAWDGSGLGWHVMWGAPSHWTPEVKICPGPVRIAQLKETVLPAVLEDDMTPDQLLDALESERGQKILGKAVTDVLRAGFGKLAPGHEDDPHIHQNQTWLFATIEKIRGKLGA